MKPRLERRTRHADDLGSLVRRKPFHVSKNHRSSEVWGEVPECLFNKPKDLVSLRLLLGARGIVSHLNVLGSDTRVMS